MTVKSVQRIGLICLSVAIAQVVGCTKAQPPVAKITSPAEDIFSNRQIGAIPDLYLVTLEAPPILKFATKRDTGWQIPTAAKEKLLKEQAVFEAKLMTLAPDAKIIYRYRMTLNAIAIYSAIDVRPILQNVSGIRSVTTGVEFARPEALDVRTVLASASAVNSVNFIGADAAHRLGYTGRGMRVGILDTGIDYTHKMLGGSGLPEDFGNINPNEPSSAFPNEKIVGGVDLVGTDFNAAAALPAFRLPHPDSNPIDEAGHGSHVAGTIAGRGDGTKTYDGVAPDATMYAIKVFGKEGSTSDAVVIAGFEYAADPNGDLNPDDQLDVINMSLGGGFGQPHALYTEAVNVLSASGTVVVASAGNAKAIDYIVGAPSTSDAAISVAASIDGSLINWRFPAVRFKSASTSEPGLLVKAVEGPISKPIQEAGDVTGPLVNIGFADVDLTAEEQAALRGKVALIQRGKVAFSVKLLRAAAAGAIGAVVYNNDATNPIAMGGDGHVDIPAVMISQAVGLQLLTDMSSGAVTIQFATGETLDEPALIDTITDFSSKGPRSEDSLIKPEIAAPGQNVISAEMGSGSKGVSMNGTSMAAPHMAGAIALLKQAHPKLSSRELKSLAMNTAKVLANGAIPITLQGAGRIQLEPALTTPVVSSTPSLSLGRVQLKQTKTLTRRIELRNLTNSIVTLTTDKVAVPGMQIELPAQVTLPANGRGHATVRFHLTLQNAGQFSFELDGRILFKHGGKVVLQVPAMAIRTEASAVQAATPLTSGPIVLSNASSNEGLAMAFNLLGEAPPKVLPSLANKWMDRSCDLQSVGYRILRKDSSEGQQEMIQFAFKLHAPVTTWLLCDMSVLIDSRGTGVADQELAGITGSPLEGVERSAFSTVLLDAGKAREIRLAYEKDLSEGKDTTPEYLPAVLGRGMIAPFDQSTIAVIEIPLALLNKGADGKLHVKMASQSQSGHTAQADKYLGNGNMGQWYTISPQLEDQAYYGMDELVTVPTTGTNLNVTKGRGTEKLVLYYPLNSFRMDHHDGGSQVLQP